MSIKIKIMRSFIRIVICLILISTFVGCGKDTYDDVKTVDQESGEETVEKDDSKSEENIHGVWQILGGKKFVGWIEDGKMDSQGNIYIVGRFKDSSDRTFVAKWDGKEWSKLGDMTSEHMLKKIVIDSQDNIYTMGLFPITSKEEFMYKWDGTEWTKIYIKGNNLDVTDMVIDGNDQIYIDTYLKDESSNYKDDYKYFVQKWNGREWTIVGQGFYDKIHRLAVDKNNDVYLAGPVYYPRNPISGNDYKAYIMKLQGDKWVQIGSEIPQSDYGDKVSALAVFNNEIYVGGLTSPTASGSPYLAKWDGTNWTSMGSIQATAFHISRKEDLYCAGAKDFYGFEVFKLESSEWINQGKDYEWVTNPLSAYFNGIISTLLTDGGGSIYCGGIFTDKTLYIEGGSFVAYLKVD